MPTGTTHVADEHETQAINDLLDDILEGPHRRDLTRGPGGTKGVGSRGGKGRHFQTKCSCSAEEQGAFARALTAATGLTSTSVALRWLLIRLAIEHGELPEDYPLD